MSTKIYSGYRLKEMPLGNLAKIMHEISPKIYDKAVEEMSTAIYEDAVLNYDIAAISENKTISNAWYLAWYKFRDDNAEVRGTGRRNPRVDWSCSVSFFHVKDMLLAIFNCEHECLEEIWASHPDIEEYAYYNNTDHPEEISDEEWDQRGKHWDAAFAAQTKYGEGFGLEWTFVEDWFVPNYQPKNPPAIDPQKRARRVAHELHQRPSTVVDIVDYIFSQEYRDAIDRESEAILKKLPTIEGKI